MSEIDRGYRSENGDNSQVDYLYLEQKIGPDFRTKIYQKLVENGVAEWDKLPKFLDTPEKHTLPEAQRLDGLTESDAYYIVDYYAGSDRVLCSFLPENKKTSCHKHVDPMFEEYRPVEGTLYLNGEVIPANGITVLPGIVHQATTRDDYALTVIIMRNAKEVPHHMHHIHVKK